MQLLWIDSWLLSFRLWSSNTDTLGWWFRSDATPQRQYLSTWRWDLTINCLTPRFALCRFNNVDENRQEHICMYFDVIVCKSFIAIHYKRVYLALFMHYTNIIRNRQRYQLFPYVLCRGVGSSELSEWRHNFSMTCELLCCEVDFYLPG